MADTADTADPTVDDFMASFERFLAFLNERAGKEHAAMLVRYPSSQLERDVFTFEDGRKYIRIVQNKPGGSKSVYCFVQILTGEIWKAASWWSPALNFTRGSIFYPDGSDNPSHRKWEDLSYYGL